MKKRFLAALLVMAAGSCVYAKTKDPDCTEVTLFGNCKQIATPVAEQELTLGTAQRNLKIGASVDEVASTMGSPNIVTKDANGQETWIYDKVSRITSYNSSGFDIGIILVTSHGRAKENSQTTQKTLTVVIKFDKNSKVESFTYHMSKF